MSDLTDKRAIEIGGVFCEKLEEWDISTIVALKGELEEAIAAGLYRTPVMRSLNDMLLSIIVEYLNSNE